MCMMCRNGGDSAALMKQVAKNLIGYGLTYVPVAPDPNDLGGGYVYTVGLTALGMPELLADRRSRAAIEGGDHGDELVQHAFLKPVAEWAMHRQRLTSASRMRPDDYDAPVLHEVAFEDIDPAPLNVARTFYHKPVQAMRVRKIPVPAP